MSSSDAQRSPVHQSTEDSSVEPSGPLARPSNPAAASGAGDAAPGQVERQAADLKKRPDDAMGVPGNFERGAATAGLRPDTDDEQPASPAARHDAEALDLPPGVRADAPTAPRPSPRAARDDAAGNNDPDPSNFGGPLNLDDPNNV